MVEALNVYLTVQVNRAEPRRGSGEREFPRGGKQRAERALRTEGFSKKLHCNFRLTSRKRASLLGGANANAEQKTTSQNLESGFFAYYNVTFNLKFA